MSALPSRKRDLVVIGCSAGGVEALPRILQQLPHDLPAAIAIVQHLAPTSAHLVDILKRTSRLPVSWAEQGESIESGHVYVAPPDSHLVLAEQHVLLLGTARENHARPAIDKLFRSAAADYGARVIGVLLTGMLSDGVAGLRAIRDVGGTVIVQDPDDAAFPDLPSQALLAMVPDHTLPIDAVGAAIIGLVGRDVAATRIPPDLALEASFDQRGAVTPPEMAALGPQTPVSCPDCAGPLWQLGDERVRRYRCYNGHVLSAHDIIVDSASRVESALWSAVRALSDRAATLEALQLDAERIGSGPVAESYESRAKETREQAELARRFMLDLGKPR